MSLDELISIERVEFERTKERIQETYVIADLTLSKLFKEILKEAENNILPILNVKVLLYVSQSIPFTDEPKGINIYKRIQECMEYQLYGKTREWNCKRIHNHIKEIRSLILYDYMIEGSLQLSHNDKIEWDLLITFNYQKKGDKSDQ
jgi:hypothetical protein